MFYRIFSFLFKQKEQVLTFAELMIQVDDARSVEGLEDVFEYFKEYQHHYKPIEQEFAKEHLTEKIGVMKKAYIAEIKKMTS